MTKYRISIVNGQSEECIALLTDKVNIDAMVDFCVAQFQNGNSIDAPADNIVITDYITQDILWDYNHDFERPYDEPAFIDDDCGFDPYEGCFTYDC